MEKRNIDQLFNERLQNYERKPRPETWDKLQAKLQQNETKIVPLWWKVARAASVVLLLGAASYWVLNTEKSEEATVAQNTSVSPESSAGINSKINNTIPQTQFQQNKPIADDVVAHETPASKAGNTKSAHRLRNTRQNAHQLLEISKDLSETNVAKLDPIPPATKNNNNTIVLVMEPSPEAESPSKATETIVLSMVDAPEGPSAERQSAAWSDEINTKKTTKLGKLWQQLKRAKNGEGVDWKEFGLKPQKVLARADAALENTKETLVESVREIKNNEK